MAEKSKRDFTNEEKKEALDFNSIEDVQFKELVVEAGNVKNAEKGAATLPTSRYDDGDTFYPVFFHEKLDNFLNCVPF